MVEFSSPNLGKEFDGLHLRSTIIGAYLASIYESMGWKVTRMNFLGDWGQHIGLLAAGWSRFGSEHTLNADPLRHLLDVYAQIDDLSRDEQANSQELPADGQLSGIAAERDANVTALEDGDPNAYALWKRFRELSIQRYTHLYARMNIRFDHYSGESEVNHETIAEVELSLQDKIVFDREGWIIDFSTHETRLLRTGHAKIRNRRGQTTYLLRDIASVLDRSRKYGFDKLLYVVSARQDSHFQQLFAILELMGHSELADRLQHVSFNVVKGLVPQEGTSGLLLSDILDQCQATVLSLLANDPDRFSHFQRAQDPDFCDSLGAIALMTQDLSVRRRDDLIFDIPNIGNIEEDTGVDLQSCVTKLNRKLQGVVIDHEDLEKSDYSVFEDEAYAEILRVLIQFPTVIKSSLERLESSSVATYLFRLVVQVEDTLGEEGESEASGSNHNLAQLAVYQAVRQVLVNGMRIIGLTPIEEPFLQEHSGIVPLEVPAEVTTEADTTATNVDDTQPSNDSDPIPAEAVTTRLLKESTGDRVIAEPAADPVESTEGVIIDAIAAETTEEVKEIATMGSTDSVPMEPASDTKSPSTDNPDPESEANVAVESDANLSGETPTGSLPQVVENLKIEVDLVPAIEVPATETHTTEAPADKVVSDGDIDTNATPEPETLEDPAQDTANPAEDVKHEASGSEGYGHYESTTSNEEQHIGMPEHVATIEAH